MRGRKILPAARRAGGGLDGFRRPGYTITIREKNAAGKGGEHHDHTGAPRRHSGGALPVAPARQRRGPGPPLRRQAQLLLEDYPDGIASVAGNAPLQFTSQDAGSKKWKQEIEEAKAREAEQEQHTKSERVKQEREARKAQFEREQAAARRARILLTVGGLCAIGAVFFLILGGRG